MKESFSIFNELIQSQFQYGGQKYAHSNKKEATDMLFDKHGYKWLVGTIDKYTFRFGNLERERDLLKISCYQYIKWLKRGFHLTSHEGEKDKIIDTTVDIKTKFFEDFVLSASDYYQKNQDRLDQIVPEEALRLISAKLASFSNSDNWFNIREDDLLQIYCLTYSIWNMKYFVTGQAGQDTDTFNEGKVIKSKVKTLLEAYFAEQKNENEPPVPIEVYTVDQEDIEILSQSIADVITKKESESGNKN